MELRDVVELSQHIRLWTKNDIHLSIHADGGGERPQPFDLDRLPAAVGVQKGIVQFIQHEEYLALVQSRAHGNILDYLRHLLRGLPLDLRTILADCC